MAQSVKASHPVYTPSLSIPKALVVAGGALLLFALFFYRLGSYPLFDMDEPRYAEAAREMLENGNWITPYFNYELRFDKPVLFYWLVAFSYQLFGVSEFAARLVSALAATSTVLMTVAFARYWVHARFALLTFLILATFGIVIGIGRMSITDMTLTAWMTATTLCLFMAAHGSLRWWLAAGLFSGLAVLTKGPVGIVLPGAVLTLYTMLTGQWRRFLLTPWLLAGVAVCLAVAAPWYVLAYQQNGSIFLHALLFHNVTRFSDTVSGHDQPVYFYVIVLLAGAMPWTVYLPAAMRYFLDESRHHAARLTEGPMPYRLALLGAVWTVFTMIFFTAAGTKLLTYILPLFPGLALFLAFLFDRLLERPEAPPLHWRWLTVPAVLFAMTAGVGCAVFVTDMALFLPREARTIEANHWNWVVAGLLTGGLLVVAHLWMRRRILAALVTQAGLMGLLWVVVLHGIMPNISDVAQGTMLRYLEQTGGAPLMLYEIQRPSLTFYGRRKIYRHTEEDKPEILALLHRNKQLFVITKNKHVPEFTAIPPAGTRIRVLEHGAVYSLLSLQREPHSDIPNVSGNQEPEP